MATHTFPTYKNHPRNAGTGRATFAGVRVGCEEIFRGQLSADETFLPPCEEFLNGGVPTDETLSWVENVDWSDAVWHVAGITSCNVGDDGSKVPFPGAVDLPDTPEILGVK